MFVNQHNHTYGSNLDGYGTPKQVRARLEEIGQTMFAITDHASITGHHPFSREFSGWNGKLIYGCEFYITDDMREKQGAVSLGLSRGSVPHITVLAKNNTGYANLLKLMRASFEEGYYYKPRIDFRELYKRQEGLIVFTGCAGGYLMRHLMSGRDAEAEKLLREMKGAIDDLYVEIIPCPDVREIQEGCRSAIELAKVVGVECAVTGDSHFPCMADHKYQQIVFAVGLHTQVSKLPYEMGTYHYINTEEEMRWRLRDLDVRDWEQRSVDIGRMCEVELPVAKWVNSGFVGVREMLVRECGGECYRIKHELDVLERKGFLDYIAIVWDVVKYVRSQGFIVVCRGSAGGSYLLYKLGVSVINPVEHGLSFERFYDDTRNDEPDIDLDFSSAGRECALEYVKKKYGEKKVARVASFIEYMEKSAINDVRRVGADEKDWVGLVGQVKTGGVHAAGVVISGSDVCDVVAVDNKGVALVDKTSLSYAGLQKFDFLVVDAIRLLEVLGGDELWSVPLDDARVFQVINNGYTAGIFQFEGDSSKRVVEQMEIRSFADMIAFTALCRPSSVGYVGEYRDRRDDVFREEEGILEDTYGVLLYQEQVMALCREIGFEWADVHKVRKAISKSDMEGIKKYREMWIDKGGDEEMWSRIEMHGGYSFNKSHGTTYAHIAYLTAWLKLTKGIQFYATALSLCSSDESRGRLLDEYRRLGGKLDVLEEAVEKYEVSRVGIGAGVKTVRGVGEKLAQKGGERVEKLVEKVRSGSTQYKIRNTEWAYVDVVDEEFKEWRRDCGIIDVGAEVIRNGGSWSGLLCGYVLRKGKHGVVLADETGEVEIRVSAKKEDLLRELLLRKRGDFMSVVVWSGGKGAYLQKIERWK